MSKSLQNALVIGLIALLAYLSYRPALNGPFVFDDLPNIVDNRLIHIKNISLANLIRLMQAVKSRSLAMLSFALNYYFGKLETFGYHLINLLIHIAAAITLYFFVQTLLLNTEYQNYSFFISASTALLFVTHPVQTQAVSYIVQRMSCMAGLFFLLTMLAYLRGQMANGKTRYLWWTVGGITAVCAFASKEISATLPLFILLAKIYLKPNAQIIEPEIKNNPSFKKKTSKQKTKRNAFITTSSPQRKHKYNWLILIAIGIVLLLTLTYTDFNLNNLLVGYKSRTFTMKQRLLTQPRVIVLYLSLLFWPLPSRLNLNYDFPLSFSLLNPYTTLLCAIFLLGILGISIYFAKKESLISFCIWWFLGNLLIESSFIPLEMVFEHRIYLPSVGLFLLVALLLVKLWQRVNLRETPALLLILPIVFLLNWGTYQRNLVWASELSLWQDTVNKSPNLARPHLSLGAAFAHLKRFEDALKEYRAALEIQPDYTKAHYNIALAMEKTGRKKEAIKAYENTLRYNPNHGEAHNNLGALYLEQGLINEAEKEFRTALQLKPEFIEIRANLAVIYSRQGNNKAAKQEYLALLRQMPNLGEAYFNLATIYISENNYRQALYHLEVALRLRPRQPSLTTIENLINQTKLQLQIR